MAKKLDEMQEESLDAGEPRVYELGFHLDPELPTEEVKKAYQELRGAVEKNGVLVAEGEPQQTQLAYTITRAGHAGAARRDFDSAYFCWLAYEASIEGHEAVLEAAKSDARVIRFIDLLTTKDAARHAAEARELALKTTKSEEGGESEETTADAELDAALENAAA